MRTNIDFATFCIVVAVCLAQITTAIGVDCNNLPKPVDLETCCPIPSFITNEIREKCTVLITIFCEVELSEENVEENELNDVGSDLLPNSTINARPHSRPRLHPCPTHHYPRTHDRHRHHRHHYPHLQACSSDSKATARFCFCALNETGIYTGYELNETQLHTYISAVYQDQPDIIAIVDESFKTCAVKDERNRESRQQLRNTGNNSYRQLISNPNSRFLACLHGEAFMKCAPPIWTNTPECNEFREFAKNCRPPRQRSK